MFFALMSMNLLQEFLRTGHVTGLLLLVSESTGCRIDGCAPPGGVRRFVRQGRDRDHGVTRRAIHAENR